MGLGASLILIAIGAVLRWGVTASVTGFNIHVVGLILMVIGVLGLVLSLIFWASMGSWLPGRRTEVVRERRYDGRYDDHYDDRAA